MAPNPIVLAKANELYPELKFDFMTWITGSCVPALFCAALLPLLLSWSCGIFKFKPDEEEEGQQMKVDGNDIIEHATKELNNLGAISIKELVYIPKKIIDFENGINDSSLDSNYALYSLPVLFYGLLQAIPKSILLWLL